MRHRLAIACKVRALRAPALLPRVAALLLLIAMPAARAQQLGGAGIRAVVLFFVASDCPVSNRTFPEMRRLRETYTARGVQTWFVYPNATDTAAGIATHQREYDPAGQAIPDPDGRLTTLARAVATPQMAVLTLTAGGWHAAYSGRIDDRSVRLGLERPHATEHDGEDAIRAVLAGKAPHQPGGEPVGCAIVRAKAAAAAKP